MLLAGDSRRRIVKTLNAAYADGLLSDETFAHRLDASLAGGLIDTRHLVGDLYLRRPGDTRRARLTAKVNTFIGKLEHRLGDTAHEPGTLLALDWTGAQPELLVGRLRDCDIELTGRSVSRRHARLRYRDGRWVLQDLRSTNGTFVNGVRVGRCELRPGDDVLIGDQLLRVD